MSNRNPFDVCLPKRTLSPAGKIGNQKPQVEIDAALRQLHELVRSINLAPTKDSPTKEQELMSQQEKSEEELGAQRAVHQEARERLQDETVPIIPRWSKQDEFTQDEPWTPSVPVVKEEKPLKSRKQPQEELFPKRKGLSGRQIWGIGLGAFLGLVWFNSLFQPQASLPGAFVGLLILAGAWILIFRVSILMFGGEEMGATGGSFGSGV